MKKFEYMTTGTIEKKIDEYREKYRTNNYENLLNSLGSQGWEIMPDGKSGGFFARREIDEPASQH